MWQPKICLQPTFQRIISYLYDYKFSIIIYPVYELHSKKSNNKEAIKQLEYDSDGDENETKALKKSSTKKKNKKKRKSLFDYYEKIYSPDPWHNRSVLGHCEYTSFKQYNQNKK